MTKRFCDICGGEGAHLRGDGIGELSNDCLVEGTKLHVSIIVERKPSRANQPIDLCPACLRKAVLAVLLKETPDA